MFLLTRINEFIHSLDKEVLNTHRRRPDPVMAADTQRMSQSSWGGGCRPGAGPACVPGVTEGVALEVELREDPVCKADRGPEDARPREISNRGDRVSVDLRRWLTPLGAVHPHHHPLCLSPWVLLPLRPTTTGLHPVACGISVNTNRIRSPPLVPRPQTYLSPVYRCLPHPPA